MSLALLVVPGPSRAQQIVKGSETAADHTGAVTTGEVWQPGGTQPVPIMAPPPAPPAPYMPTMMNPTELPAAPVAATGPNPALLAGLVGLCTSLFSGLSSNNNLKDIKSVDEEMDRRNNQLGNVRDPSWDDDTTRYMGTQFATLEKGCSNFIDSEGRIGPWGRTIQAEIKENTDAYADNVPDDVLKWCPGYKTMSKDWRERFWIWTFASIASSESSCNPVAVNRKCNREDAARTGCKYNPNSPPNGDAIGLFQLEPRRCPRADENALMNALETSRCAARVLAGELRNRSTLLDYRRETYWGPLRGNTGHRGDASGRDKMLAKLGSFKGCR